MKRFLLFAGPVYYPGGGWGDFCGDFDTAFEATTAVETKRAGDDPYVYEWAHTVDTETGDVVHAPLLP